MKFVFRAPFRDLRFRPPMIVSRLSALELSKHRPKMWTLSTMGRCAAVNRMLRSVLPVRKHLVNICNWSAASPPAASIPIRIAVWRFADKVDSDTLDTLAPVSKSLTEVQISSCSSRHFETQ